MDQNESLLAAIALLYKWKKQLLGATFLAAVLTAGVALMLPNYFKAHTLFYAANPDLAAPAPLGNTTARTYVFGTDHDLDRLFSLCKSTTVLEKLNEKFDLYQHYEINPEDPLAPHKLSLKFQKLYKVTKTKYDAIDLSVEDTDPEFASLMANTARMIIDEMAQNLIKASQQKQIVSYQAGIDFKEKEYKYLLDSLNRSKTNYKIFSSDSQGEAYGSSLVEVEGKYLKASGTLEYLKKIAAPQDSIAKISAQLKGLELQLNKLKKDVSNYNIGFPIVKNLERITRDHSGQLHLDKRRLDALRTTFNAKITAIHIVEEASVPIYKSRPKRSIVVIGAAFITFVLMSLWVLLRDQYTRNNWKELFTDA